MKHIIHTRKKITAGLTETSKQAGPQTHQKQSMHFMSYYQNSGENHNTVLR